MPSCLSGGEVCLLWNFLHRTPQKSFECARHLMSWLWLSTHRLRIRNLLFSGQEVRAAQPFRSRPDLSAHDRLEAVGSSSKDQRIQRWSGNQFFLSRNNIFFDKAVIVADFSGFLNLAAVTYSWKFHFKLCAWLLRGHCEQIYFKDIWHLWVRE